MTQELMPRAPIENWLRQRDEWISEVNRLKSDVVRWSQSAQWDVHSELKDISEDEIGDYQVPILTIQNARGRLYFDPVARFVVGSEGRIDFLGAPSFSQIVLLRRAGVWKFFSEEMVDLNKPWSETGFMEIARLLVD